MDDIDLKHLKYINKLIEFHDDPANTGDIDDNAHAKDAFIALKAKRDEIPPQFLEADRDDSGATDVKGGDEELMIHYALGFSFAGVAYCNDPLTLDAKLGKKIAANISLLTGGADGRRYINCKRIYELVGPIVTSLTSRYPDAVTDYPKFNTVLGKYFTEMDLPDELKGDRAGYRIIGKRKIDEALEIIHTLVEPEMNITFITNPNLYTRWIAVNKMDDNITIPESNHFTDALAAGEEKKLCDVGDDPSIAIVAKSTGVTSLLLSIKNTGADVPGATPATILPNNTVTTTKGALAPSGNEVWIKNLGGVTGMYDVTVG